MGDKPSRDQIEIRAYQIYVERGYPDGEALEHWLAAEQELSNRESLSTKDIPAASTIPEKSAVPLNTSQRSVATAGRTRP